jgi:hypothetical protein
VGGRTRRLIKDIARENNAPVSARDWMITRIYLRVRPVFRPAALAFQDLDAYAAAWHNVLVAGLREYKAAAAASAAATRTRCHAEARFARSRGHAQSNSKKAHALRAWRRNAERMARHWPV